MTVLGSCVYMEANRCGTDGLLSMAFPQIKAHRCPCSTRGGAWGSRPGGIHILYCLERRGGGEEKDEIESGKLSNDASNEFAWAGRKRQEKDQRGNNRLSRE